jgi:allantoate deiminase
LKLEIAFGFADQDLFTIADVPEPGSQTVIARCRELAAISEIAGGTLRTFLSPAMKRCYEVVGDWMKHAGMPVKIDPAGNLRGILAGVEPGKCVLMMGSHLDTVRDAGAFDGILGVVMAIALAERFNGWRLPFDIEVIGFSEEEGVRFGVPFIGSKGLVGLLDEKMLARTDSEGITIAQAIRNFGLDPNTISKMRTEAAAFLEFHIEQGPVLDSQGEAVGVVEAIAGQSRAAVKFTGSANHAGTTPMNLRRDALGGAASFILATEIIARTKDGLVATVGKIHAYPNAANVIPGEVTVSLDVRHADDGVRLGAYEHLRQTAAQIADAKRLALEWTDILEQKATRLHPFLISTLEAVSPRNIRRLVSGAGHDAMILAPHIPTAMLFLRSPGGISHHPAESVLPEDVDLALEIGKQFIESMSARYK